MKKQMKLQKTISYRLQFIDSARFIASSLSNLAEGIHEIKSKYKHNDKDVKLVELITKIETAFLNTQILKMI